MDEVLHDLSYLITEILLLTTQTSPTNTFAVSNQLSFLLAFLSEGANGDGMAVVSSLRSFDREQQKEYLVPIVIKDSGSPAMSGTSTLTIIIGDTNDNKMQPGAKEILVYSYMGEAPSSEIGRVYVYDLDDWDLADKTFSWQSGKPQYPYFSLNKETGMITMKHGTPEGRYRMWPTRNTCFCVFLSLLVSNKCDLSV